MVKNDQLLNCTLDDYRPFFFTEIRWTWRHSNVIYRRLIEPSENPLRQDVWNWSRKWYTISCFSFLSYWKIRERGGAFRPPNMARDMRLSVNNCLAQRANGHHRWLSLWVTEIPQDVAVSGENVISCQQHLRPLCMWADDLIALASSIWSCSSDVQRLWCSPMVTSICQFWNWQVDLI